MTTRRDVIRLASALGLAGALSASPRTSSAVRTPVQSEAAHRGHKLAAHLAGWMDVTWLNRSYAREEYIRDGEWEELAGGLSQPGG